MNTLPNLHWAVFGRLLFLRFMRFFPSVLALTLMGNIAHADDNAGSVPVRRYLYESFFGTHRNDRRDSEVPGKDGVHHYLEHRRRVNQRERAHYLPCQGDMACVPTAAAVALANIQGIDIDVWTMRDTLSGYMRGRSSDGTSFEQFEHGIQRFLSEHGYQANVQQWISRNLPAGSRKKALMDWVAAVTDAPGKERKPLALFLRLRFQNGNNHVVLVTGYNRTSRDFEEDSFQIEVLDTDGPATKISFLPAGTYLGRDLVTISEWWVLKLSPLANRK